MKWLSGLETEYGLYIEGHGAEEQIEDAKALVRGFPNKGQSIWDYRFEHPRADLRGYTVEKLTVDPEDAKFDAGRSHGTDRDFRSDRILPNGARFYNDHGHPEYSTPECESLRELMLHDWAGHLVVLHAAQTLESKIGRAVRIYKNNTDFHGASYGTHESYLVPRRFEPGKLMNAVLPILVARTLLCGAGKVGSESGPSVEFQMSQRADFLTEIASVDTLYRRPIFNTRDEPHADAKNWIRLHVIAGDANMMPSNTMRKVGLVRIALALLEVGAAPEFDLASPPEAFREVSRNLSGDASVKLTNGRHTSAADILETTFQCAERALDLDRDPELRAVIQDCRKLLVAWPNDHQTLANGIDWAAKRAMLQQIQQAENLSWSDPAMRSFDLEYHQIDPEAGLFFALPEMGIAEHAPDEAEVARRLNHVFEPNRAYARSLAISKFGVFVESATWGNMTFLVDHRRTEVPLRPDRMYPMNLSEISDVDSFIQSLLTIARGES